MIAQHKIDINNLRVAKPCPTSWESMTGDAQTRHCDLCSLNVYNISAMTEKEAQKLISDREGRLCIRLYRRADGTVLTKDCPVGLRAVQKRVTRFAGATLTAVLGLFSVSFGQKEDKNTIDASKTKIVRTIHQAHESELTGTVTDSNGAVIPSVEIRLYKKGEKKPITIRSNDEGLYIFKALEKGIYSLEISAISGFSARKVQNIEINPNEKVSLNVLLSLSGKGEVVGIYAEEPLIDVTSTTTTTVITSEMMDRIPH